MLYFFAPGTHVCQNLLDSKLVDRLDPARCDAQLDPAPFTRYPETVRLDIRLESTFGLVVSVRNIVA